MDFCQSIIWGIVWNILTTGRCWSNTLVIDLKTLISEHYCYLVELQNWLFSGILYFLIISSLNTMHLSFKKKQFIISFSFDMSKEVFSWSFTKFDWVGAVKWLRLNIRYLYRSFHNVHKGLGIWFYQSSLVGLELWIKFDLHPNRVHQLYGSQHQFSNRWTNFYLS